MGTLHTDLVGDNLHIAKIDVSTGTPDATVTAAVIGQMYWDSTNNKMYVAEQATNSDWVHAGIANDTLLELSDVDISTYTSKANFHLKVKSDETGIDTGQALDITASPTFVDLVLSTGGITGTDLTMTASTDDITLTSTLGDIFLESTAMNVEITPAISVILNKNVSVNTTTGALRIPRLTTTQRDALTPLSGMVVFNTTTLQVEAYNGTAWVSTEETSPGGSNMQVQYNANGVFGGNAAFTFDADTSLVKMTGKLSLGSASETSAILEIDSTTQGFLPPRMTTTERDAITLPAEGLIVHNLTTDEFQSYNGTTWVSIHGDVVGPSSSTDNAVVKFDTTTGDLIQDTGVIISDLNSLTSGDGTELLPAYSFTSDPATGMRLSATSTLNFSAGGVDVLQLNSVATAVTFLTITPETPVSEDGVTIAPDGTDTDIILTLNSKGADEIHIGVGASHAGVSIGPNSVLKAATSGVVRLGSVSATTTLTDGRVVTVQSNSGETKTRISLIEALTFNELSIGIGTAAEDSGAAFFENLDGTELRIGTSAGDAISISSLAVSIPGTLDVTGDLTLNENALQNPADPVVLGTLTDATNMGSPTGVVTVGNYAYVVAAGTDSIAILDITDKTAPALVGSLLDGTNLDSPQHLDVAGKYAYIVSQTSTSLTIVDISNPTSPSVTGILVDATNFASVMQVRVLGKYAYTITQENTGIVSVIDISDPTTPVLVGSVASTSLFNSEALEVVGDHAYTANTGSMSVIDISDPVSPSITGSISNSLIGPKSIDVSGQYAYLIDFFDDSFVVVDVSDPTTPVVVGSLTDTTNLNQATAVVVSGRYAYVQGRTALAVIDVSDPTTPVMDSFLTLAVVPSDLFISGKYIYSTQTTISFSIIDVTGIDSPSANIGSLEAGYLSVTENATIANNLRAASINVGFGGIHSDGDMSTSIGKVSVNPSNIIEIHSLSDFDDLASGGIVTISSATTFAFKADITTSNRIVVDSGISLHFTGEFNTGIGLTYSGTDTFFTTDGGSIRIQGSMFMTSTSTGTFMSFAGTGVLNINAAILIGWDDLGTFTEGTFLNANVSYVSITSGWTITNPANIIVNSLGLFGTDLTDSLFALETKESTTIRFNVISAEALSTTASILDLSTQIANDVIIIVSELNAVTGTLYKKSILTDATITGTVDASPATGTITAMATNADGQTTFSSTTTYFEGEEVTISGTTSYDGEFKIFNVVAGVSFDTVTTFVADDATGSIDSERLDFGLDAGHGIVSEDDLKVIGTNHYNGFVTALTETGDVLTVNGTFVDFDTGSSGSIELELSLDETDPRVNSQDNRDVSDSTSIAFGHQNANTSATTITDMTYVAVTFSGITINQDVTEGFRLVDSTNYIWEYIKNEPFTGVLSGNISMLKTGSTANYRLAMSTNSVAPTFATAPYVPIEVKTTQITKPFTFSVALEKGDTIELMVAGDGTSNSLTFTDIIGGAR